MNNPFEGLNAREIWERVPDGLLLVDRAGSIRVTNDEAREMFDYPDGMVGMAVEDLMPSELASAHLGLRDAFHEAPRRRTMGSGLRLDAVRRDGSRFPVQISLSPLGTELVIAAVRDVTDVAAAEERLVDSARRRILAEDHERIAKDMHDTVIQELFALGMSLQATATATTEPETETRLEAGVGTLDEIIRSIRSLIFDLRTDREGRDDLRSQLVEIATSLIPSLGFEPSVSFRGAIDRVPKPLHDHVLAMTRESLTNVARHAEASAASIEVIATKTDVNVIITDDGIGVPREIKDRSGLANLDERARLARGMFSVDAHPEGGTTVRWSCPVSP